MPGWSAASFEQLLAAVYIRSRDPLLAFSVGSELTCCIRLANCAIKQASQMVEYFTARLVEARERDATLLNRRD